MIAPRDKPPIRLVEPQFKVAANVRKATKADEYVLVPVEEYRELVEAVCARHSET